MREAAEKQAGADEKEHRERKLRSDENAAKTLMAGAGGRAARTFVQRLAEIESRGTKSRRDAEGEARGDRDEHREYQHRTIEPDGKG